MTYCTSQKYLKIFEIEESKERTVMIYYAWLQLSMRNGRSRSA